MKSPILQFTLACLLAIVLITASSKRPAGSVFVDLAPTVADRADVYLYRGHALAAIGDAFTVRVDGQRVGMLHDASYLQLSLSPGRHRLEVAPGGIAEPVTVDVAAEAGRRAFYEFRFPTGLAMRPSFPDAAIVQIDRDAALAALPRLHGSASASPRPTQAAYLAGLTSAP